MKTLRILAGCVVAAGLMSSVPAFAQTDFRVSLDIGNAPPPPRIYVTRAPRTVWLPDARVSVVRDPGFGYDTFQVGGYWYVYNDGYWYRARNWRGPFVVIHERYVPRQVALVPARHWRHGRPWRGYASASSRRYDRYDGRYDRRRDWDRRDWNRHPDDIWDEDGDGVPNSRDLYDRDPRRH
jgi:hypothetical protein